MDVSSLGDLDGEGNAIVPGQEIPPCGVHRGTCVRCHTPLEVKPRKKFQGEERRQRKTISIKVPKDAQENGGAVWDSLLEQAAYKMGVDEKTPPYYILIPVLYAFVTDQTVQVDGGLPDRGEPQAS